MFDRRRGRQPCLQHSPQPAIGQPRPPGKQTRRHIGAGDAQLLHVVAVGGAEHAVGLGRKRSSIGRQPGRRPMIDKVQQPPVAGMIPAVEHRRAEGHEVELELSQPRGPLLQQRIQPPPQRNIDPAQHRPAVIDLGRREELPGRGSIVGQQMREQGQHVARVAVPPDHDAPAQIQFGGHQLGDQPHGRIGPAQMIVFMRPFEQPHRDALAAAVVQGSLEVTRERARIAAAERGGRMR